MSKIVNPFWKNEALDMYIYVVYRDGSVIVLGRCFKEALGGKWHCSVNKSASTKPHHCVKETLDEAKCYIEKVISEIGND